MQWKNKKSVVCKLHNWLRRNEEIELKFFRFIFNFEKSFFYSVEYIFVQDKLYFYMNMIFHDADHSFSTLPFNICDVVALMLLI